jgi:hypothetical protein
MVPCNRLEWVQKAPFGAYLQFLVLQFEQSRPLLTFDIPQTALVATLDAYDFNNYYIANISSQRPYAMLKAPIPSITEVKQH